jgi:hypothetical protein
LLHRVSQSVDPDATPPAGQQSSQERRGACAPQTSGPGAVGGQSKTGSDYKTDYRAEDHQRFHATFDSGLAERLPARIEAAEGVENGRFLRESWPWQSRRETESNGNSGNFLPGMELDWQFVPSRRSS